ncbi:MAG: SAVED domain-containing protein [Patescibacteria group bacterium]|jgi:hypothetical protein
MTDSASLLGKQAMGGLYGEGGYKFQDAYIVSKIPDWICDANFIQILKEGSGDVDIAFNKEDKLFRIYTQIKGYSITQSEFKTILKEFKVKDASTPNTYQRFVLASTGLNDGVTKLKTALERIRGSKDYFTPQDQVSADTLASITAIAKELGADADINFILEKVHFDFVWPGFTQLEQVIRLFCGGMQNVQSYQEKIKYFRHIFHPLYSYIVDSSGKTINRADLEAKMTEFVENYRLQMEEQGFTLRMYHWESTPYELKLEYDEVLDWSKHFEKNSRKIAPPEVWQKELLPELSDLEKRVRESGTVRLIKFEGSACLSAGVALGWAFPEVGEYVIELLPRLGQKTEPWRTDTSTQRVFNLTSEDCEMYADGSGLAVKFNIVADVTTDLNKYISESGSRFKASLQLTPESGVGETITKESAISYARSAKRLIREAVTKYSVDKISLFFAGPLGIAIFLGQLLNAMPEVQCYEQKQDRGYQLSCLIPRT